MPILRIEISGKEGDIAKYPDIFGNLLSGALSIRPKSCGVSFRREIFWGLNETEFSC